MKRDTDSKIPEFTSLKEERDYWETRGPLAKGHKGRINKSKSTQRRSSFLSIRLTGEELTLLRDTANKLSIAPSSYARMAIMSAIQQQIFMEAERRNAMATLKQDLLADRVGTP